MSKNTNKIDLDLIYKAIDMLDLPDDAEVRKVVDYAIKLRDEDRGDEAEEPTKKDKKPLVIVTASPLPEPILGFVIQREPTYTGMMNESGEYEEGIAPTNWGELETGTRLLKVMTECNANSRFVKRNGKLECLGDIMEYATRRVLKEQGMKVKTKHPVAIVSVADLIAAKKYTNPDNTENQTNSNDND